MVKKKNRKKAKDNGNMTFIIIPQTTAKPLKLNVSRNGVYFAALLVVLLIVTSSVLGYFCYVRQAEIRKIESLKQDNLEKDKKIRLLGAQIEEIKKQQDNVGKKQEEIKRLMGIKDENDLYMGPSRGGSGGQEIEISQDAYQGIGDYNTGETKKIQMELALQENELDELMARVSSQKEYFRSIPNQWPVKGEITSPYGWRKSPFSNRGQYFHDGIDIANKPGTVVVSAGDGIVTFAGWQGVYGKMIVIDHGSGFVTKYGHNSALLVTEGTRVKKGEPIARLGNTGRSTGPHLHFSIFKEGASQDPLIYLP